MSNTRLTYLQKVELEKRPTPQGPSGPSPQCYQPRCLSLASLAGPNPTEPAGTLPNRARRIITRQLKTTPLGVLRMEARVPSILTRAQQQAAAAYEKARCLLPNHPHRTLIEVPCCHRLKRPSWLSAPNEQIPRCHFLERRPPRNTPRMPLCTQKTMVGVSRRPTHRPTTDSQDVPSNHPPPIRPANSLNERLSYGGDQGWLSQE